MTRQRAFTLIEVLVALAIVAFGLTALFSVTNQTARASSYLREKTLAQWIAVNKITETRLSGQPPAEDESKGEIKYADQDWRWELQKLQTPVKGIVRLEARARLDAGPQDSWPGFAVGFMGDAIAQPGTASPNWVGDQTTQQRPAPGQTPAPGEPNPSNAPPANQPPPGSPSPGGGETR
ncbi:MAG TPA: type II secretion system minor pseudopilin GspI [Steroidobacteraceae bacterium]|jgi:general secretion pathway protein I